MDSPVDELNNVIAELAFGASPSDLLEVVSIDDVVPSKGMITINQNNNTGDVCEIDIVPCESRVIMNSPTSVVTNNIDNGIEQDAAHHEKDYLKKGFVERFLDSLGLDKVCGLDDDTLISNDRDDGLVSLRRNLSVASLTDYCLQTHGHETVDPFVSMDGSMKFLQLEAYGEGIANESHPPKELRTLVVRIEQEVSILSPVSDIPPKEMKVMESKEASISTLATCFLDKFQGITSCQNCDDCHFKENSTVIEDDGVFFTVPDIVMGVTPDPFIGNEVSTTKDPFQKVDHMVMFETTMCRTTSNKIVASEFDDSDMNADDALANNILRFDSIVTPEKVESSGECAKSDENGSTGSTGIAKNV
jgi:hypothetical protein